jgi:hypothetical protein
MRIRPPDRSRSGARAGQHLGGRLPVAQTMKMYPKRASSRLRLANLWAQRRAATPACSCADQSPPPAPAPPWDGRRSPAPVRTVERSRNFPRRWPAPRRSRTAARPPSAAPSATSRSTGATRARRISVQRVERRAAFAICLTAEIAEHGELRISAISARPRFHREFEQPQAADAAVGKMLNRNGSSSIARKALRTRGTRAAERRARQGSIQGRPSACDGRALHLPRMRRRGPGALPLKWCPPTPDRARREPMTVSRGLARGQSVSHRRPCASHRQA